MTRVLVKMVTLIPVKIDGLTVKRLNYFKNSNAGQADVGYDVGALAGLGTGAAEASDHPTPSPDGQQLPMDRVVISADSRGYLQACCAHGCANSAICTQRVGHDRDHG